MTRFFAFAFAALALAFSACERHPIAGETLVTHTHGSNGDPKAAHGEEHAAAGEHKEHAAAEAHGEKPAAEHAAAPAAPGHEAGKAEEKPTFFPGQEKK